MSRPRIYICLLLMALAVTAAAHSGTVTGMTSGTSAFLPLQPDSASAGFSGDFFRWIWGKQQRATERGERASHDSGCDFDRLCEIYSGILNVDVNENAAPSIYNLMSHVAQAGIDGCSTMCPAGKRKRPFVLMNEQPWGENDVQAGLSDSTSYPSIHAAMVWSTALALAQMAPHLQDTILGRAMECANSSVITGAHWQSDVDVALICASAALTKERATSQYASLLTAARDEYMQLTGLSESDLNAHYPTMSKIMDAPPTVDEVFFAADVEKHWYMATLRDTERGALAAADASLADDYLISCVDACSPMVRISEFNTPNIVMFIKTMKLFLSTHVTTLKNSYYRRRPFVQLKEDIPYGGEAWQLYTESSYPSRHAMIGWGLALALAEVMPDCQDALFMRGYDYGDSREIEGMCYASDVLAARIMAICDLGKLHNETIFNTLLDNAINEYKLKRNAGDVNGDGSVNSADITALYDWLLNSDDSSIVNGDQDGDGHITSGDVTVVYDILLGN